MPSESTPSQRFSVRFAVTIAVAITLLVAGFGQTTAQAQIPYGFSQVFSPFVSFPWFKGEMRVTPIWIGVISGKNTLPDRGQSWGLRTTFNMTKSALFLDMMGRFQLGPVAFRVHGEQRDFVGSTRVQYNNSGAEARPRLEFSGCRVGLDIDLFRRYGVRAGLNCDYYCYRPSFTESVVTPGQWTEVTDTSGAHLAVLPGKKLLGESPWTAGIHASLTVPREFYGAWPVVEARVSWPLQIYTSPEIWDLEIAAGLRGPGTVLGSLGMRAGYRRTAISFQGAQLYSGSQPPIPVSGGNPTQSKFDAVLSGWFGELVYYY